MLLKRFGGWLDSAKILLSHCQLRSSRSRTPRRRKESAGNHATPAEILEMRQMLTANVVAIANNGQLTLTSDNNGDHNIQAYRLDANTVEVDALAGTSVNGAQSAKFTLPDVSKITVNLGKGKDSYEIFSAGTHPALNVGSGGILFQGSGGVGDTLMIGNTSSSPMTIDGDITVQGASAGSPLSEGLSSLASQSFGFQLYSGASGGITVNGSVKVNESENGLATIQNEISSGAGTLVVKGDTSLVASSTTSNVTNEVNVGGVGNVKLNGNLSEEADSTTGKSVNQLMTDSTFSGNIVIAKSVEQSGQTHSEHDNEVLASKGTITIDESLRQDGAGLNSVTETNTVKSNGAGSLQIGVLFGSLTQDASGASSATNEFSLEGSGNVTVIGYVSQSTLGQGLSNNDIHNTGSGTLWIKSQVQQAAISGAAGTVTNDVYNQGTRKLIVGPGGININTQINSSSTAPTNIYNKILSSGSANAGTNSGLVCEGAVNITSANNDNNSSGNTDTIIETTPGAGPLSATGVTINNSGKMAQLNRLLADGASLTIGNKGVLINGSGQGSSDDEIKTATDHSKIQISGDVLVTEPGNGQSQFTMSTNGNASPILVTGAVHYDNHLNQTGTSYVSIQGQTAADTLRIGGDLIVVLANSVGMPQANNDYSMNQVQIGSDPAGLPINGTIIFGATKIQGTNGPDHISFERTSFESDVNVFLGGSTVVTSGSQNVVDSMTINSCTFVGATTVSMSGPSSSLIINNNADADTTFLQKFTANMTGSTPDVEISPGVGLGFSNVKFVHGANIIGKVNGGGKLAYHLANISGPINEQNFTVSLV